MRNSTLRNVLGMGAAASALALACTSNVGCSSDDTGSVPAAPTADSGQGGAAGHGGVAGSGTGGTAGTSAGGTAGTSTGGAAGMGTGGTAGTGAPPLPGEKGGACDAGDACNDPPYWTCEDLTGKGKFCTQSCIWNSQCPDNLRCEQVGEKHVDSYCLYGPRGTAAVGEPCGPEGSNGCASSFCWDADESQPVSTCSGSCIEHLDCPITMPVCWSGICGPVTAGNSGGVCLAGDTCTAGEGTCIDVTGVGKRCAKTCVPTDAGLDPCFQDYLSCQPLDGQNYCLVKPK